MGRTIAFAKASFLLFSVVDTKVCPATDDTAVIHLAVRVVSSSNNHSIDVMGLESMRNI